MAFSWSTDKQAAKHPNNGIPLRNKKDQAVNILTMLSERRQMQNARYYMMALM